MAVLGYNHTREIAAVTIIVTLCRLGVSNRVQCEANNGLTNSSKPQRQPSKCTSSIILRNYPLASLNIKHGSCFQPFCKLARWTRAVCAISDPIWVHLKLDPPRLLLNNIAYGRLGAEVPFFKHVVAVGWSSSFINFEHLYLTNANRSRYNKLDRNRKVKRTCRSQI